MARLLVVDDEERIRQTIAVAAKKEGHTVTEAGDGYSAVKLCMSQPFDAVIMDVMMPKLDGLSACSQICSQKNVPVILLSARGEESDRIHGFEAGASDYVVKPFSLKELMLRVNVVTRRAIQDQMLDRGEEHDVYEKDELKIDFTARRVTIAGKRIDLTPKEYELLFYLATNRNVALSREQLITKVWGYDYYGDDRTLDTHIKRLRRSLGEYRKCIVTLRGIGYRFDDH